MDVGGIFGCPHEERHDEIHRALPRLWGGILALKCVAHGEGKCRDIPTRTLVLLCRHPARLYNVRHLHECPKAWEVGHLLFKCCLTHGSRDILLG